MHTDWSPELLDPELARLGLPTGSSPVAGLVTRTAVAVAGSATLAEAAAAMRREDVSALLVDGGDAIVTERDITRGIGAGCDPTELVGTVATPHPLTVDGSISIIDAAGVMVSEHVRHLVLRLPDGAAVLSFRDVTLVLLRAAITTIEAPSETWLG